MVAVAKEFFLFFNVISNSGIQFNLLTSNNSNEFMTIKYIQLCGLLMFFGLTTPLHAETWQLKLEGGAVFQTRSDVQIPPDTGTRFSLVDAVGKGPLPYGRLEGWYAINDKHRLRFLIAPLAIEDEGQLDKDVDYDGKTFAANTDTTYRYQFNSYRLGYAYRFVENPRWTWDVGFTAKIRDAEIKLTQGNTESGYPNLGFVPLLHLSAVRQFSPAWRLQMDLDGSWSPFGRAVDLGLFLHRSFGKKWQLGAGYRTVEGGADVDSVYNFAWFHYLGLQLQRNF